MRKQIALMVFVLMVRVAFPGVTIHLSADCRTGVRTVSSNGEDLRYDAGWYTNGNQARITDNGVDLISGSSGLLHWLPTTCGNHHLQLTVASATGMQVGSATADFQYDHIHVTNISAVAATCTAAGRTAEVKCSRCGEVLETSRVIAALGHDPQTTVSAVAATCTVAGRTVEVKCSRCGVVFETSRTLAALGHLGTVTKSAIAPTSGAAGRTEEIKCSRCGTVIQSSTTIPALGYVRNVTARQLWPHKKVEVCYEIAEDIGEVVNENAALNLTGKYGSTTKTATNLLGDKTCTPGMHRIVWDFEKDSIAISQSSMTFAVGYASVSGTSVGVAVNTSSSVKDGMAVAGTMTLGCSPIDAREVELQIDGTTVLSSDVSGEFAWMPRSTGTHTLKHIAGTNVWTRTVNVTELAFVAPPAPNPPAVADGNIKITQTSHSFMAAAGTFAIPVQGVNGYTGTYAPSVSDPSWITINSAEANWKAGRPLVYGVTANNGVEERVGYVYISGHVHTITQAGIGAELSAYSADFEAEGGEGRVTVLADAGIGWQARPNADWIFVNPTSGAGERDVTFSVAPWNAVSTRSGTVTIAGKAFTINQTGRHMKLDQTALSYDYNAHVAALTVTALSSAEWDVEPQASWISVVDAGPGKGGGNVTLAVAENPSYLPRTGTARIGTETVTVTQAGRPTAALSFTIDPVRTGASVKGANGLVSVTATPDLPWSAKSGANWLTVMPSFASGAGNGNVVYTASPNSTMAERTGTIIVTPEAKSGLAARTHTVVQPAATAMIAADEREFAADGDSFEVGVSVAENVGWSVVKGPSWVTIDGSTSRVGPGTVKVAVSENLTVDPREATIAIAGHEFHIFQPGRTIEVEYESIVFGPEGGDGSIEVNPDGNVRWTACPSDWNWISIWGDDNCDYDADGNIIGIGSGTVYYYVSGYVGDGGALTGYIQIGDKRVYLTQRAYDLNISPSSVVVGGNAGAGQVSVPATVGQLWNAIATEPWITIVSGYDAGSGNGTVRYTFTDNDTGKTRTGRIIIAGEEYEVRQAARQLVKIEVEVQGGGGEVDGAGVYDRGAKVTLTARPNDGYEFVGWSGDVGGAAGTLTVTADVDKHIVAEFRRIPVYVVNGETIQKGMVKQFAAPEPRVDGAMKLVCKGTSAFPDKGTSFQLKITEAVSFEWDLWDTNYLLTVETPVHGKIKEGNAVTATRWVKAGETVTLTTVPDSGYAFFRWTGDGADTVLMDRPKTVGAIFGVFNDTLAMAMDVSGLAFTTGGDAEWMPVIDALAQTGYSSVRSGAIGKEAETWLETTVTGSGSLSFDWRVDCEKDDGGGATWDRLSVFTNGVEAARLDGKTNWQRVTLPVSGKTTVRWSFYRDDWDEAPPGCANCGWLDGVIWTGKEGK